MNSEGGKTRRRGPFSHLRPFAVHSTNAVECAPAGPSPFPPADGNGLGMGVFGTLCCLDASRRLLAKPADHIDLVRTEGQPTRVALTASRYDPSFLGHPPRLTITSGAGSPSSPASLGGALHAVKTAVATGG